MIQSAALMLHSTISLIGMVAMGIFGYVDYVEVRDALVAHTTGQESFAFGGIVFAGDPGPWQPDVIYRHEYGHVLQERQLGIFYLPIVVIPSVLYTLDIIGRPYVEDWADDLGARSPQQPSEPAG